MFARVRLPPYALDPSFPTRSPDCRLVPHTVPLLKPSFFLSQKRHNNGRPSSLDLVNPLPMHSHFPFDNTDTFLRTPPSTLSLCNISSLYNRQNKFTSFDGQDDHSTPQYNLTSCNKRGVEGMLRCFAGIVGTAPIDPDLAATSPQPSSPWRPSALAFFSIIAVVAPFVRIQNGAHLIQLCS
uniref:Transmembrane protein n=1 Tax=Steinernema glaseri TaxID=37863 RepID=A0A1I8A3H8_9BILA